MQIAVVIPCFRTKRQILSVISKIGGDVSRIYVVDDCCPEGSGKVVEEKIRDHRVKVIFHETNQGVGGAMITGYRAALADGMDIVVKIDGDGQMDPTLVSLFASPIADGSADYVTGNRFFDLESLKGMPSLRLFGNTILSFLNKFVSGYWNLMDPTNGLTAVHSGVLRLLPLDKLDKRYFFESDMLFRLNTLRAVVAQIPMTARYGDEKSSLHVGRVILQFPRRYVVRFLKRIFYNYLLRDFNAGSVELFLGLFLFAAGVGFGLRHWYLSGLTGMPATTGTVMLAALPVIFGFQLLMGFLSYDVANVPKEPIQKYLLKTKAAERTGVVVSLPER